MVIDQGSLHIADLSPRLSQSPFADEERCLFRELAILALAALTAQPAAAQTFVDATGTNLPPQDPRKFSMAGVAADLDGDGDLDLAIAREYAANAILFNDGKECFTDVSADHLTPIRGDHEDVVAADFDRDGDLDLVFVGEDDRVYGYHLNSGDGWFIDVTGRLPSRGVSNAVATADLDGDGNFDLYIGNNGPDFVFIGDGRGFFTDESAARLPQSGDITQHVELGDVDLDGDIDAVLGNEDGNVLLLNDGSGYFTEAPLPPRETPEETRDADLVDVDGDGDLDLFFSNVRLFLEGADQQDRLLLNDGTGTFTDVTADALPQEQVTTMWSSFVDFDGDGDLDLLSGSIGDLSGRTADAPLRAYANDGTGRFTPADIVPATAAGNIFDIVIADFDGDGLDDAFLASRGGVDRLLLRKAPVEPCD
jgi:hypothetical protein